MVIMKQDGENLLPVVFDQQKVPCFHLFRHHLLHRRNLSSFSTTTARERAELRPMISRTEDLIAGRAHQVRQHPCRPGIVGPQSETPTRTVDTVRPRFAGREGLPAHSAQAIGDLVVVSVEGVLLVRNYAQVATTVVESIAVNMITLRSARSVRTKTQDHPVHVVRALDASFQRSAHGVERVSTRMCVPRELRQLGVVIGIHYCGHPSRQTNPLSPCHCSKLALLST